MLEVIAQNLAQVTAVAVSPMPLICLIVLMLAGSRAAALSWVAGWLITVAVLLGLATVTSATPVGAAADETGVNYLAFVLAGLFLWLAWRSFGNRPAPGTQAQEPAWLSALGSMSEVKVFLLSAALIALNAKNLPIYAAVGASVAAADLGPAAATLTIAILAVLSTLSAIVVVAVPVVGGETAGDLLERWRGWLIQHNSVVMAVLFLFLGLTQLGNALGSL